MLEALPVRRTPQVVAPVALTDSAFSSRSGNETSISPLLNAVRRQWPLGLTLGMFLAIPAALAIWNWQQPTFSSSAFLRLSSQDVQLMFQTADQAGREDFRTFKNTQRQIVLSPFVLSKAVNLPEVAALPEVQEMPDPIQWLESSLQVTFLEESEIMKVELVHTSPKVAQTVVTGVVDAYINDVVEADKLERTRRLENLEVVFKDAEAKTRTKREALRAMADSLGTSDTESLSLAQQGTMNQFGLLRSELMKVQFELMRAEGELEMLNSTRDQNTRTANSGSGSRFLVSVEDAALDEAAEKDSRFLRLTADRERLAELIAQTEKRFTPDVAEARVADYRQQIAAIDSQLEERKALLGARLDANLTESKDPAVAARLRVGVLQRQEQQLKSDVGRLEEEAKKFGRSSIDVEMMRKEIDSLDGIVQQVAGEIERTKIELRSASRISKMSDGTTGTAANARKKIATSAGAGLMAFGFPLLLLVARDLRRQHVDTSQSVTESLGLQVLGTVPTVPARYMRRLKSTGSASQHWRWRLTEAVNSVAAMVLRSAVTENRHVFLISSAESGEGKSTLANYLASSLAESGHRTLLIDFDLRRPTLHSAFGIARTPGVTDVLTQKMGLLDACVATDIENLSLIPAGQWQGNLLADSRTGALKELVAEARNAFDFVIIDGSPALAAVDARLVGQYTDGVLLTVRKDISQMPRVVAACEALRSHGIRIVGTVLSGCDEEVYYDPDYHTQPTV